MYRSFADMRKIRISAGSRKGEKITSRNEASNSHPELTCFVCDKKGFPRFRMLKDHLSVVHFQPRLLLRMDPSRPSTCPICDKTFSLPIAAARHLGTVHDVLYEMMPEEQAKWLKEMRARSRSVDE